MDNFKSLYIKSVRKIANDANGKAINIIVIETTNGAPALVRSFTQFLQDLKNSELIDDSVTTVYHPQVSGRQGVLRGLKRGMVSGDIAYTKKGDKYQVTENSSCLVLGHPEFGKWSIGDTRIATEDRARVVDGFLDLEPNERFDQVQANAMASATVAMAGSGIFEDFTSSAPSNEDSTDEQIDNKLVESVTKPTPEPKSKGK